MIESAAGLPAATPMDFLQRLFWAVAMAVGQLWRRLVRPYRRPPFVFAALVDPQVDQARKTSLANFLLRMPACCCDKAFIKPIRSMVQTPEDILTDGGVGHQILQSAFCSKNTNIQVETNFGRASSMSRVNRGRTDRAHNLLCKHLLAEVQAVHRRARFSRKQKRRLLHDQAQHVLQDGLDSVPPECFLSCEQHHDHLIQLCWFPTHNPIVS